MKMQYSMWVKGKFEIIEAKSEASAFEKAVLLFGVNNFHDFKRYYPDQNKKDHKLYFLKRAISNVTKHIHKANRHKTKL